MTTLVWDQVGDHRYEVGIDRGVLYLTDGRVVPWNGLISVDEKFEIDRTPVYYDGSKLYDHISLGSFSGTMKALTYPDEFMEIEGLGILRPGLLLGDQAIQPFGLSYRTRIGNDTDQDAGYKIHILYNVIAIPNDKEYASISDTLDPIEFEWDIFASPEEVVGFRPTAHLIVNSIDLEPALLQYVEDHLYGTADTPPSLISLSDLVSYLYTWARIDIIDNGDGTWTANFMFDTDLSFDGTDPDLFTIINANAVYLTSDEYNISNTTGSEGIP